MEKGQPSGSAIFAAMNRYAHLILDDKPKILEDTFARDFSGMKDENSLISALDDFKMGLAKARNLEYATGFLQSYRGFTVVRHRYTEDELEKSLQQGISRYVILGAGLDSFAFRKQDIADNLKVYEIDHPATQQWKKNRLQELNIGMPSNLAFVPVDFENQDFIDELNKVGFQSSLPVFFSWLGVTPYLTEIAVFQTLQGVATMAPGSVIVFEYVLPDSILSDNDKLGDQRGSGAEPWLSDFEPDILSDRLAQIGFSDIQDFGPEEAYDLYFSGRTDELSVDALNNLSFSILRVAHLMKAVVAGK